ncbi:hypothetical protein FQN60_011650 [Etheostoma spectabile]|uniref:Uncharacterized protein n=1 Tax=Etheostoma spectabile TaxID=54343 RepID=A0A5J5DMG3_9PERO|nr:hypothetical protein FQN60_011650 [Etheostoma spectabile]
MQCACADLFLWFGISRSKVWDPCTICKGPQWLLETVLGPTSLERYRVRKTPFPCPAVPHCPQQMDAVLNWQAVLAPGYVGRELVTVPTAVATYVALERVPEAMAPHVNGEHDIVQEDHPAVAAGVHCPWQRSALPVGPHHPCPKLYMTGCGIWEPSVWNESMPRSLLKLRSRQTPLSPRPAAREETALKTPQEDVSHTSSNSMTREIPQAASSSKNSYCLQMEKDLIEVLTGLQRVLILVLSRGNVKATQRITYTVNWSMPGSQDRRSFTASESPEPAVKLGGMRGQRAERKQTTQTKASSAAAPQKNRQRGTCSLNFCGIELFRLATLLASLSSSRARSVPI